MITTDNIRTIDVPAILGSAADKMYAKQASVFGKVFDSRTGYMQQFLSTSHYVIGQSADNDGVSISVRHPRYILALGARYSDKAKTKPKKVYAPIYYKYVYGFLQGYVYDRLRGGITQLIANKLFSQTIEL